jgi:cation transport ATPase
MRQRTKIRSAIRGRERWQIAELRSRPRYAAAVERALSRHELIRHVWANPLTGRLLVQYDPGMQRTEVQDRLLSALAIEPATPEELAAWRSEWPRGFNRSPEDLAVEQARFRAILSGTLFGVMAAKRLIFGAGMFSGAPALVTVSAVLTILGGYTLLRRRVDAFGVTGGFSGRTVLSTITLGVLVAAESLDGIGALAIAHAGELLEAKMVRRTRDAVKVLDTWWAPSERLQPLRDTAPRVHPYEAIATAALIASGGMLAVTGDYQRAMAMLVGACPVAGPEATITARALALWHAVRSGIIFRTPETVTAMPRRPVIVLNGASTLRGTKKYGLDLARASRSRRVVLLSGESQQATRALAREAGISEYAGKLTAERKLVLLEEYRAQRFAPVVIGGEDQDDAAVLAAADVGISAIARRSRESLDAANVLLAEDDPRAAVAALALMHRATGIVRQDQWISRLIGAAGFTAAAFGRLTVSGAAQLHNYTRMAMELNSLRLLLR